MALAGLFLFTPLQGTCVPETVHAAQVSDPHDSKLSAFDIAPGTLSPAFSPDILEYTATVDAGVTDVSVQAVPRAAGAVIASVEGRNGLRPGVNTVKATCSAQDNTYTVYTITLTVGSADAGTQPAGNADGTQPGAGNTNGTQPDAGGAGGTEGAPGAGNVDGTSDAGSTGSADGAQPDAGGTQPDTGNTGGASGTQPDTGNTGSTQSGADKAADKKSGTPAVSEAVSKLIGKVASDGTVTLNGASYRLSSNFIYGSTAQDIPSAFGQGSAQIKGNSYSTLYCEANKVHLVYMENTDGNGSTGFYFYDKKQKAVERFKYTGIGDNFVVFISAARKELPAGFQETVLTLPSGKDVVAYQDQSDGLADYYLIYGINSDGSNGWYLYDRKQGTYMRYSNAFLAQPQEPEEEKEVARTVSLEKYNTLNERYTDLKKNRVRIVSIMSVVMVLLIILFTALLLRVRDDGDDGEEEDDKTPKARKAKKAGRQKKQPETISKSSLAAGRDFDGSAGKKAKKVTKNITQEPFDGASRQPAGLRDGVSTPEEIRAQVSRGQTAQSGSRTKKSRGQNLSEQKMGEQQPCGQKLNEQQPYGQRLNEQRAYGQKLNEQHANEQKLNGQRAYEQKLNEQRANEQKLKEQRAYEQKLNEQRAYEQKLNGQRAYEQKMGGQHAYASGQPQQPRQAGTFSKGQPVGPQDSVQLAAEKMRQSMKYPRKEPEPGAAGAQRHDPMDDWDMDETQERKKAKSSRAGRKKRSFMDEDVEIMDLNDL